MPGINEVWSLVSGTRSNPQHGDAYGSQDPYASPEGTSGAAEYYYEDQYNQQQPLLNQNGNQYSDRQGDQHDQYAGSSAGYYEQAPYGQQQGFAPGYESGYGEATQYQDGQYAETPYAEAPYAEPGQYVEPGQYAEAQYTEISYAAEYTAETYESGYAEPSYPAAEYTPDSYSPDTYAPETNGYAPESGYDNGGGYDGAYGNGGYSAGFDGTAELYDGPGGHGAQLYGAASSFAAAGTATALATEAFATSAFSPPTGTAVDTLDPESTSLLAPVPAEAPEQAPDTAAVPAPRRGRGTNQQTRPATKTSGSGKPPTVLRTRPRTGPVGRIVQGTVLAALVAGAVTYVAFDKTITLNVDGQTQTMHTFASTVGAVLTADDISTGSKDIVSPSPGTSASDDETITVHYGRPLSLSVNGVSEKTWVHYSTVSAALAELGVRTTGAQSSDAMSAVIPRTGMTGLVVYTMRHVTFLVDGKTVPIDTTAATVTQAMAQAGIVLHNQDAPSVAASSVPTEGETISINRITGTTETKEVSIPFQTTQVSDSSTYTGTSTVTTQGVDGEETITYAVQVVNGVKQAPKQISESVTTQPVNEVVSVGTKALPSSASDLDWSALANCESGGNPAENTGNGFYGMYQFTIGTWDSLGGSGLPSDASAATQTALAEKLYTEAGSGQWPVCGHYLFS